MVVYLPSQQEVSNSAPRYSYPVNMRGVRGAGDPFLPGVVELMELAGGQADIEPIWQPILVGLLAGGTEVVQVVLFVLDSLKYSDLLGRMMTMVYRSWPVRAGLLIRADLTLRHAVRHLVQAAGGGGGQQGPGSQQTEGLATHSKHKTQQ